MLRTLVASLVLCLVLAVAGTAAAGLFWLTLVALAAALLLGAVALTLVRSADDEEVSDAADVRPLPPARRLPRPAVPGYGRGATRRAA